MNNNKILQSYIRAEYQELLIFLLCKQLITSHCRGLLQEISVQAGLSLTVLPGCFPPPTHAVCFGHCPTHGPGQGRLIV